MNKVCAMIVLYNGTELTTPVAKELIATMYRNGLIDDADAVTIHFYDPEKVAEIMLKESSSSKKRKPTGISLEEKLAAAIGFIGTSCKDTLKYAKDTGNYALFEIELRHMYVSNTDIQKSVDLLATETFVLKRTMAEKYNFSAKILDIIKTIYRNHH